MSPKHRIKLCHNFLLYMYVCIYEIVVFGCNLFLFIEIASGQNFEYIQENSWERRHE